MPVISGKGAPNIKGLGKLRDERERTIQQIADMFGLPRSTVYRHLDKTRPCPANSRRPWWQILESYLRVTCPLASGLGRRSRQE
ncbi:helix-turn-helix domain-containing protein [Streptomyces sp. NPDC003996]